MPAGVRSNRIVHSDTRWVEYCAWIGSVLFDGNPAPAVPQLHSEVRSQNSSLLLQEHPPFDPGSGCSPKTAVVSRTTFAVEVAEAVVRNRWKSRHRHHNGSHNRFSSGS